MVQWFKANGFEPRAMAMTDIMTGLTTGMIEACRRPRSPRMLFQWYRQTPYMLDIGLAPVVGATVITKKTWNAIAAADRAKLLEAAAGVREAAAGRRAEAGRRRDRRMKKQRASTVTKATGPEWRQQLDALAKTMRGEMVPPDIFDLAVKARDAFRKTRTGGRPRPSDPAARGA